MNIHDAKVLVVDDDALMRRFISITLKKISVEHIYEACDGASAIAAVEEFNPDVILSDIHMHPMSGFEFVRLLRALPNRQLSRTAVILLSADEKESTFHDEVPLGIFGHLKKPPNANELAEMVGRALKFRNRGA